MRYLYSIIRFAPNPATGERVNLAVLVGNDDQGEWGIRRVHDLRRARALDDEGVLPDLTRIIDSLQGRLEHERVSLAGMVESVFNESEVARLHEEGSGILELGEPSAISAESLEEALEIITPAVLVEHQPRRRQPTIRKTPAVQAIQEAYERQRLQVGKDFVLHPRVTGGPIQFDFDFAVMNGSVVQLAQAWSFALSHARSLGERIKSWGWTVHGLRDKGGAVELGFADVKVPEHVDVVVAYVPPQTPDMRELFAEAQYIFAQEDVRLVRWDNVDSIADTAVRSLGKQRWSTQPPS